MRSRARRLITTADDFGLTIGVNEAVQLAATHGILTSASLMVAGPEAADAVRRAKATPALAVGLHLVVIEGAPTLPPDEVPDLVNAAGEFPSDQLRLGVRYFFSPRIRRQLAAEIRAQFEAFHATGLTLDHANAHKHMHLHPTVGRMMIDIGRDYGLRAIRVPAEPPSADRRFGAMMLRHWSAILRCQARKAGLATNDQILGLGATGHMTADRVRDMLGRLPPGLTEMYVHPAAWREARLEQLMPDYEHVAEFRALMECTLSQDTTATTFGQETTA